MWTALHPLPGSFWEELKAAESCSRDAAAVPEARSPARCSHPALPRTVSACLGWLETRIAPKSPARHRWSLQPLLGEGKTGRLAGEGCPAPGVPVRPGTPPPGSLLPREPRHRQHRRGWLEGRCGALAEAGETRRSKVPAGIVPWKGLGVRVGDGCPGWEGRMDSRPARQGWTSPGEGALQPAGKEKIKKSGRNCSGGGAEREIPAE